jgi:hypothetical protein
VLDQRGLLPPATEICRPRPGWPNGITYTCRRPLSSDSQASRRPSGDTAGSSSFAGPVTSRRTVSSPVSEATPTSRSSPLCTSNAMRSSGAG